MRAEGHEISLWPGDSFQPCTWRIPSRPIYDIYWTLSSVIVSERLAVAFEREHVSGVSFSEVVLSSVGAREAIEPYREEDLGDHERPFEDMDYTGDVSACGRFFDMVIENASGNMIVDQEETAGYRCPKCGFALWTAERDDEEKARCALWVDKRMIPNRYTYNVDAFSSHIFCRGGGIMMSDRAFALFTAVVSDNYQAQRIEVAYD